jgi:hypothetical protein
MKVSELSLSGTHACRRWLPKTSLGLILLLASACSSAPSKPNYVKTQAKPDEEAPEPKPVETRRLNQGEVHVEGDVAEPPRLSGFVLITTWANEEIKGQIVSERDDAYVLDTAPLGAPKPTLRTVSKAAVMDIKATRRSP